jgi:integrase
MEKAREAATHVKKERGEKPKGKTALAVDDLVRAVDTCDTSTALGLRNRAIIVLGFATAVRRSELAALRLSDVSFEGEGLRVFVGRSKTDQEAKGRSIAVYSGQRPSTDPVSVLRAWISKRGEWAGPLFSRIRNSNTIARLPLSGQSVAGVVKSAVGRAGLDASHYGGHSLRSGAATACAKAGRSTQEIMLLTGHKTAAMVQVYVRDIEIWNIRNPLPNVL